MSGEWHTKLFWNFHPNLNEVSELKSHSIFSAYSLYILSHSILTVYCICYISRQLQICAFLHITRSSADADNGLDAFSGQSRSTNIVPFHILHIVSYCAIVTLSWRRAVFTIVDFKNAMTLKTWLGVRQGHWKCHHVIEHIWLSIDVL